MDSIIFNPLVQKAARVMAQGEQDSRCYAMAKWFTKRCKAAFVTSDDPWPEGVGRMLSRDDLWETYFPEMVARAHSKEVSNG